jgi:hypothetical protein
MRIAELTKKIKLIQCEEPSEANYSTEAQFQYELYTWFARNETIWRQKSRETWLKDGDCNSIFFFFISPLW